MSISISNTSTMKPLQITDSTILHSAAHVLAAAVIKMFPNVVVGIGPVLRNTFYYDFSGVDRDTIEKNIDKIQNECDSLVENMIPITQTFMEKYTAYNYLLQHGQLLKAELLQVIDEKNISFYSIDKCFTDLCRGPHVSNTKDIGYIFIKSVTEVYWNNDPSRAKMVRINGVLFYSKNDRNYYSSLLSNYYSKDFFFYSKMNKILKKLNAKNYQFTVFGVESLNNITNTINNIIHQNVSKNLLYIDAPSLFDNNQLIDENYITSYVSESDNFSIIDKSSTKKLIQTTRFLIEKKFFAIHVNIIQQVLKLFRLSEENNLLIEVISVDFDENVTKLSLQQVQMVSQNLKKIYVNELQHLLSVKVYANNQIGDEIKISEIIIDNHKDQFYSITVYFDKFTILKLSVEANNGFLSSLNRYVDIVIIPINKNSVEFCNLLHKDLLNKHFRVITLSKNKSLMSNIITSDILHPKVTCVVGDKEVRVNGVSTRVNRKNLGIIKLENLEEYIKSL